MQIATITIVVNSDGPRFSPDSNDINEKAMAKLQAGEYTADIEESHLNTPNA